MKHGEETMKATDYRAVIVTGPQRSGTRIVAKILAQETGYTYVDEQDSGTVDLYNWRRSIQECEGVVLHCPGMSAYCHEAPEDILVVFIYRDPVAIRASEQRINWDGAVNAMVSYGISPDLTWLEQAKVKYMCWENDQREQLEGHYLEISYPEDIEMHELYIPPEDRKDFEWNQTGEVDGREDASG